MLLMGAMRFCLQDRKLKLQMPTITSFRAKFSAPAVLSWMPASLESMSTGMRWMPHLES